MDPRQAAATRLLPGFDLPCMSLYLHRPLSLATCRPGWGLPTGYMYEYTFTSTTRPDPESLRSLPFCCTAACSKAIAACKNDAWTTGLQRVAESLGLFNPALQFLLALTDKLADNVASCEEASGCRRGGQHFGSNLADEEQIHTTDHQPFYSSEVRCRTPQPSAQSRAPTDTGTGPWTCFDAWRLAGRRSVC